jgi:hypothetical protein
MNVENHGKLPLHRENIQNKFSPKTISTLPQCFLDELEKQNSLFFSIFPQFEASFSWHKKNFLFDREVKKSKENLVIEISRGNLNFFQNLKVEIFVIKILNKFVSENFVKIK